MQVKTHPSGRCQWRLWHHFLPEDDVEHLWRRPWLLSEANDLGVGLPCRMWWVKTQPILGWHQRRLQRLDLLESDEAILARRLPPAMAASEMVLFSLFLPFFFLFSKKRKKEIAVYGVGCGGSCRRPNLTGQSSRRLGSMSQSDRAELR
jgi:hypothetical protein